MRRHLTVDDENKNVDWESERYEVLNDEVSDRMEELKGMKEEEKEEENTYVSEHAKSKSNRRQLHDNEDTFNDAEQSSDILALDVNNFYVEDVISTNANSVGINYTISFIIQKYGFSSKYGF